MMDFQSYLKELTDPASRLRVSALVDLSQMSPEEAEQLSGVWPGLSERRRRRVVRELTELAEDNVELNFDAVFIIGLSDADAEVRLESVRGLWEYEKPNLIEPMLRLVAEDENAAVRAEAALTLGRYVMLAEEGKLRDRHFREVEEGLRGVWERKREVLEVRARALEAIGAYDESWVRQAIREAYESGVRRLKVSAVHAMGRSCQGRWLPLLLRELASEEPEIRYEAALACGAVGDEEAVPQLASLLEDEDLEVRQAAIAALGEIGGGQARMLLRKLTDDASPTLSQAAEEALAEIEFGEDPLSFKQRL